MFDRLKEGNSNSAKTKVNILKSCSFSTIRSLQHYGKFMHSEYLSERNNFANNSSATRAIHRAGYTSIAPASPLDAVGRLLVVSAVGRNTQVHQSNDGRLSVAHALWCLHQLKVFVSFLKRVTLSVYESP